jgi:hypothetical protein
VGLYPSLFGYINAASGCDAPFFEDFLAVTPCEPAKFVLGAHPWFFAATSGFGVGAGVCGGDYRITMDNYVCSPISVQETSWGEIKGKYAGK